MSSASEATSYVRRMVEREYRGNGDLGGAVERICRKSGLEYWPVEHLRRGKAKTVDAGLFKRIRSAYINYCEQQVAQLQHEIRIERAIADNDDLEQLEIEAAALAAKIEEKRKRQCPT